jgi:hypothetical protein
VTTTVRSVRVELEMGIAGYVANARIAGRETDKAFSGAEERISATSQAVSRLDRNTGNLAKTSTQARVQQSTLGREIERTGTSAGRAERSIDKYSGRLRVLTDIAVIGGPALLRLGAGSLPAVAAGLVGIGAAGGGIAVTALAVSGLKDALKALDQYQLQPTTENLEKLRIEQEKLGPAGTQFLHYLDQVEPKIQQLQQLARAGIFPGFESGIDDVLTRLPLVRDIVTSLSAEVGNLAADAGSAIASDKLTPFLEYIRTTGAPTLDAFARSAGNVALGLARVLVAFDPATQDAIDGMVSGTERFAKATEHLDKNEKFQAFLSEVREAGPDVIDFLGSAVGLMVGLAHAAAPFGHVVRPWASRPLPHSRAAWTGWVARPRPRRASCPCSAPAAVSCSPAPRPWARSPTPSTGSTRRTWTGASPRSSSATSPTPSTRSSPRSTTSTPSGTRSTSARS